MLKELNKKTIDFCIKKNKFFGQTKLEEQSLNLTPLGMHSTFTKNVELQGARLGVTLMLHRAAKTKEFE